VWVQNQEVDDDVDGDPDCQGCFEMIEKVDQLWSQAARGAVANCDPSLEVASDAEFDPIAKGSGRALQVEKGGHVRYVEMTGSGIERAEELAEKLEQRVLHTARCVLDQQFRKDGPQRTATEVERDYSSMTEQADTLREQYEGGIKRLLGMVLRSTRLLNKPRVEVLDGVSRVVRYAVEVPPRPMRDDKGQIVAWVPREIGQGNLVELHWPDYFTPSGDVIEKAVTSAAAAKEAGILDAKHAALHVAAYFGVENVGEMLRQVEAERPKMGPDGFPEP
jgi:hypothetical protein